MDLVLLPAHRRARIWKRMDSWNWICFFFLLVPLATGQNLELCRIWSSVLSGS